jgi:ketosteroid isomerase-like protein
MKARILLIVVASFVVWPFNFAVGQNKHDTAASTVLTLEHKWNEVYKNGDIEGMNSLLADDYIMTEEDGSTFSKPGYIAYYGNSTVQVDTSKMSALKVRMHGNTAVVTGEYHEKGMRKRKPYEYRDRFTDVWMSTNGRWQLIVSHYSVAQSSKAN